MEYIVVKSQAELDAVPVDTDKIIRIEFGTAECPAVVSKKYRHFVKAYGNSTVEAHSAVAAYDNCTVKVYGSNIVIAWDNSTVEAYDKSTVKAQDSSTVKAWGNVQICKTTRHLGKITTHANARVVAEPKSVDEFLGFYGISSDESTAVLYKAVHKIDEGGAIKFVSNYDKEFEYKTGEKICSNGFDMNSDNACSQGIHVANLNWVLDFGASWDDLAILELKVNVLDIVIPDDSNGEVRVPEALVVREVPLEECGAYGKILTKRRKINAI